MSVRRCMELGRKREKKRKGGDSYYLRPDLHVELPSALPCKLLLTSQIQQGCGTLDVGCPTVISIPRVKVDHLVESEQDHGHEGGVVSRLGWVTQSLLDGGKGMSILLPGLDRELRRRIDVGQTCQTCRLDGCSKRCKTTIMMAVSCG